MNDSVDLPDHAVEPINTVELQIEATDAEALLAPAADDQNQPDDDAATTEDTGAADETVLPPPPRVFISHKQDKGGDNDQIAMRLKTDLGPHCEIVYLDLDMRPGDEYVRAIEEELSNSDFVIALISEAANRSDWIRTELDYAHNYFQLKGSPRIIPVRLGYEGPFDLLISVYIGKNHVISFDPVTDCDQYESKLLGPILEKIEEPRPKERSEDRLSGFVVHESRRQRFRRAFLEPSTLQAVRADFRDQKLLWITGAAGVRNYLGLSLAIDLATTEGRERIYELSKPRSWSQINSTVVGNAVIVFQDSTPAAFFEETTPKAELDSLRSLIGRGNRVIVTLSEEDFQEVEQEIRKEKFEYSARRSVTIETFGLEEKITIFRRLLDLSLETNALRTKHFNWVLKTLEAPAPARQPQNRIAENRDKLLEILNKCTPADIDQFFTQDLRQVRQGSDFLTLLQQNAGGDEEVHAWFLALDDSAKCFVLAIALCSELDRRLFWENYKLIVRELRALDRQLALLPIGVGRDRARPFVTTEGPLDFTPRVADLIRREIGATYREYLVELKSKLKEWSAPKGREKGHPDRNSDKRRREVNETQAVRINVARLIGTAAKQGLDEDIKDVLNYWATDPSLKVRDAVAVALEECAQDIDEANAVLDLLRQWGSGSANDEPSIFRLYATALPLTRFALANSGDMVHRKALAHLRLLARDRHESVRFYTSIAVKKMARKIPLTELRILLESLCKDDKRPTRINVAQALNEARIENEEDVLALLDYWLIAEDHLRWVGICSLLIYRMNSGNKEENTVSRSEQLKFYLQRDAPTVADVLVQCLSDARLRKSTWRVFSHLVWSDEAIVRDALVRGLAAGDFDQLNRKLLEQLKAKGNREYELLVSDIRREWWHRVMQSPHELVNDLDRTLRGQIDISTFRALTDLADPALGYRSELIESLIQVFEQQANVLDRVLMRLQEIGFSIFQPICFEVLRRGLRALYHKPVAFVERVITGMTSPTTKSNFEKVLVSIAQSASSRPHLEQALAYAYAVDPTLINSLLMLLKESGSITLSALARNFIYTLLGGKFDQPPEFFKILRRSWDDKNQQEMVLDALQRLASPGPSTRRRTLVRMLADLRANQTTEVDELLAHPRLTAVPMLKALAFEVNLTSVLDGFFVPNAISQLFVPN